MSPDGSFITGSDFLIDGGATASFFYDLRKTGKLNCSARLSGLKPAGIMLIGFGDYFEKL